MNAADNHVCVFPYPGGKGRESDWILEKMPEHRCYVEPFGGSGALIYNKPESRTEIYNDVNDDLVQFFRVLRERPEELREWLQKVPYARSVYDEWATQFYEGERPEDPIERAGRFYALRFMTFAGATDCKNGFKVRHKRSPARTFNNARDRLEQVAERFSEVVIENRDFEKILGGYDSRETLFYCDPPYLGRGKEYYGAKFDHARFADALIDVDGDWMVSYTELPDAFVARLIGATRSGEDFYVLERERRHRMCRGASDARERLVCNFDPESTASFVEVGVKQEVLS